jgi:hypothetical protein
MRSPQGKGRKAQYELLFRGAGPRLLEHEHFTDRPVLESPPPSAFAADGSFHAARPAETLAESMIEWSFA